MKASTVLAAVVAAFAASCAAHPALRGQDSDPRDPGALLSRGDRPTPALPAPAAPSLRRQDLEQDGEATAPRGGGRRGAEKAPGAPALQADRPLAALPELAAPSLGVQVLEQDGEATAPRGGGRRAFEEAPGAPTLQADRPLAVLPELAAPSLGVQVLEQDGESTAPQGGGRHGSEEAPGAPALQADRPLAVLPELAAPSLGVQVLEQDGEATAPRGGGRRAFEEAPGAPDGQRQVALLARAPEAPDQSPRVRELQRVCGGDVLSSSYEFCGFCVDSNGQFYEGILFYDVPDHEDCFAHCPVSDKFVGYDYLPSNPSGLHCICRYEDGTVVREYCPEGICRNEDGTVTGNSCPNGSDDSSSDDSKCRTSISWFGEGPVVRGNDDSNVACRAKLFTTGAAFWALHAGQTYDTDDFRAWVTEDVPGMISTGHVKNPLVLVREATSWQSDYTDMFRDQPNVPDVSFWDVSRGTKFDGMFGGTYDAGFDQNIGAWDVSNGTDFKSMFINSQAFNQNIGAWDVSNGEQFQAMFANQYLQIYADRRSAFNQDIGSWDVSSGTDFSFMFQNSKSFDQDLSGWRIEVAYESKVEWMFHGSGMDKWPRDWHHCPCIKVGNDDAFHRCPGIIPPTAYLQGQRDSWAC